MFRVVERSKLSLKFGNETFMDCHLSISASAEDDDEFVAETRTEEILLEINSTLFFFLEIDVDDDFFELKKDDFDDDDAFREENATNWTFGFVAAAAANILNEKDDRFF